MRRHCWCTARVVHHTTNNCRSRLHNVGIANTLERVWRRLCTTQPEHTHLPTSQKSMHTHNTTTTTHSQPPCAIQKAPPHIGALQPVATTGAMHRTPGSKRAAHTDGNRCPHPPPPPPSRTQHAQRDPPLPHTPPPPQQQQQPPPIQTRQHIWAPSARQNSRVTMLFSIIRRPHNNCNCRPNCHAPHGPQFPVNATATAQTGMVRLPCVQPVALMRAASKHAPPRHLPYTCAHGASAPAEPARVSKQRQTPPINTTTFNAAHVGRNTQTVSWCGY